MSGTSLLERVESRRLDGHVLAAAFTGETPLFITATGQLGIGIANSADRTVAPAGVLAVAVQDGRFTLGDEDGRILRAGPDGELEVLAEAGGWIDAIALGPDGAVAWSVGKAVSARDGKGRVTRLDAPSAARGLAFMPKGYRLALSHYNGASLWFPATSTPPQALNWKGSHLDCTVSPDGRYVVTSMQENALHGWRVTDSAHMRMTGYPAKTRSMSWSHDGNWLATSGAEAAIIWPFSGKDGPMGKAPRECGVRPKRVSAVAFHPSALVLAIGYEDGWVLLVRLTDAAELLVRAPKEAEAAKAISALAWDRRGQRLAIGGADGFAALLTLP